MMDKRRKTAVKRRRGPGLVLGLTGSIAMGKSTAAQFLRTLGLPVFDADAVVHGLLGARSPLLPRLKARFPDLMNTTGVDRARMGALVFSDPAALRDLEAILHPAVHQSRERFLRLGALRRRGIVALEVPLLFEGKGRDGYDLVAVVSAPAFLQQQRALARPGMTPQKLKGIRARQMSDTAKRARADAIIPTGLGKRETLRHLKRLLTVARARKT